METATSQRLRDLNRQVATPTALVNEGQSDRALLQRSVTRVLVAVGAGVILGLLARRLVGLTQLVAPSPRIS